MDIQQPVQQQPSEQPINPQPIQPVPVVTRPPQNSWKIIILIIAGILVLSGVSYGAYYYWQTQNKQNEPVACTQEAKLCSDGSSVGRTGPNCEFAECPIKETMSPKERFLAMRVEFFQLAQLKSKEMKDPQDLSPIYQSIEFKQFMDKYMTAEKIKEFESVPGAGKDWFLLALSLSFPEFNIAEKDIIIKEIITGDTATLSYTKGGGTISGGGVSPAKLTATCAIAMVLENKEWKLKENNCTSK